MNEGWIKIYRQLLSWEWFDNSKMVHIFLYFLLRANTEDKEWRGLTIRRGQFAVSVPTISAAIGLSEQEIRTCVKRLVDAKQIVYDSTHRATHRCVIVTICNYEKYQSICDLNNEPNNEPPTDKQRTSNEPPTDKQREYKNNKNKKNKKNIITPANAGASAGADEAKAHKEEAVNFEALLQFFNAEMDKTNALISRAKNISGQRLTMLKARIREYGKEAVADVIRKAARSNFLNGGGSKGFKVDFTWIVRPENFLKILEGKFDNDETSAVLTTTTPKRYVTTPISSQHNDRAARQQEFALHIATKLTSPDDEPDVSRDY